jgi:hypothetical protein
MTDIEAHRVAEVVDEHLRGTVLHQSTPDGLAKTNCFVCEIRESQGSAVYDDARRSQGVRDLSKHGGAPTARESAQHQDFTVN